MSRWPNAYALGPQKLSKIEATSTGRLRRTHLEYQELGRSRPTVVVDSPLVGVDYAEIEARILAKEKK